MLWNNFTHWIFCPLGDRPELHSQLFSSIPILEFPSTRQTNKWQTCDILWPPGFNSTCVVGYFGCELGCDLGECSIVQFYLFFPLDLSTVDQLSLVGEGELWRQAHLSLTLHHFTPTTVCQMWHVEPWLFRTQFLYTITLAEKCTLTSTAFNSCSRSTLLKLQSELFDHIWILVG